MDADAIKSNTIRNGIPAPKRQNRPFPPQIDPETALQKINPAQAALIIE
jgi:hypothetical protein